jgi:hypothetical protein
LPILVGDEGVAHPVRLQVHCQFELVARQHLVIARPVDPRVRVEDRAVLLEHRGDLGTALFVVGRGSFEEHVLQEVGRSRVAHRLVPGANPVDDHEGHHRGGPLRHQQDLQTIVLQSVFRDPFVRPFFFEQLSTPSFL